MRLQFILIETISAAVILLPVMVLLHKVRFRSLSETVGYTLFALYLSAVYALVGLPNVTYIRFEVNLNLIPFVGMIDDLRNSFLNVLMFVPLGFFLPYLCEYYRKLGRTLDTCFLISLGIELLQMCTFRATDINDLITNTIGSLIGFVAAMGLHKAIPKFVQKKGRKADVLLILVVVFNCMFFVQGFISSCLWKLL